jgi:hypothetical protein
MLTVILAATDNWYSSADFWGEIGAAITFSGIVATIWLWWVGVPRPVLYYWIASDAALVSSEEVPGLKVLLNDREVDRPHLVRLCVLNQGRRDIKRADFDGGEPLRFTFGVAVLGLLPDREDARSSPVPFISDENEVLVRPMLIRRKVDLTVDVLTEGEPELDWDSSLADVTERRGPPRSRDTSSWRARGYMLLVGVWVYVALHLTLASTQSPGFGYVAIGLLLSVLLLAILGPRVAPEWYLEGTAAAGNPQIANAAATHCHTAPAATRVVLRCPCEGLRFSSRS